MTTDPRAEPPESEAEFAIDSDGVWWHDGRPIEREALVKLFATRALCFEGGEYWLKTPKERHRVAVEDVPFIVVDFTIRNEGEANQTIELATNIGERFTLGPENPLIVEGGPGKGVVIFYAMVRGGLKARANRTVNYELVAHAMEERDGDMVIRSGGEVFTVVSGDF